MPAPLQGAQNGGKGFSDRSQTSAWFPPRSLLQQRSHESQSGAGTANPIQEQPPEPGPWQSPCAWCRGPDPGQAPPHSPARIPPGRAAQPGSALPARSAGQTPAPAVGPAGKRRRQRREGLSRPLRLTDSAGGQSWPRRGGINPALAGGSSCLQARLGKEPPRSFVPGVLHAQVLRKAGVPQCFQEGHEGGKQV
ncbi:unnamed protein product [Caretta caretta]